MWPLTSVVRTTAKSFITDADSPIVFLRLGVSASICHVNCRRASEMIIIIANNPVIIISNNSNRMFRLHRRIY